MLHNWIYAVVGASVLCAACTALIPEGRTKKALEFVCGLVMIAAILSPFVELDLGEYSLSAAKYKQQALELADAALDKKEILDRRYIESEYAAYILDKAKMNGVVPDEVSVTTEWSTEGYWYPVEVEIILSTSEYEKDCSLIKNIIESELGVAIDKQNWRTK